MLAGRSSSADETLAARLPVPHPAVDAAYDFLASQESSYITGERIGITGGMPTPRPGVAEAATDERRGALTPQRWSRRRRRRPPVAPCRGRASERACSPARARRAGRCR